METKTPEEKARKLLRKLTGEKKYRQYDKTGGFSFLLDKGGGNYRRPAFLAPGEGREGSLRWPHAAQHRRHREAIRRAGFKEADFAGHSLRAGFLTSAAENGASIFAMMDVSRHKSVETVRGYVRRAEEFKDHAGAGLL